MLSKILLLLAVICFLGLVQAAPLGFPLITDHAAQTSDFDVQAVNTALDDQLGTTFLEAIVGPSRGQHKAQQ
ncbi:uncharacterized protein EV154DRAFT_495012 [Mucor mucedo]|uniref:uncharacterized protein n=1 Tax=Mucor mucedo TaxID=29922 RepID=UPI00221E3958|nr:uncharacterized protein EV154DRAFT_495012 [Mucor mucedo]KAI7895466.1 hypothetical protein EV154DRAFT_495012 [Mucor mucedo]